MTTLAEIKSRLEKREVYATYFNDIKFLLGKVEKSIPFLKHLNLSFSVDSLSKEQRLDLADLIETLTAGKE